MVTKNHQYIKKEQELEQCGPENTVGGLLPKALEGHTE